MDSDEIAGCEVILEHCHVRGSNEPNTYAIVGEFVPIYDSLIMSIRIDCAYCIPEEAITINCDIVVIIQEDPVVVVPGRGNNHHVILWYMEIPSLLS